MKIGCGEFDNDTFLTNIEIPSDEFLEHINKCDNCKTDFTEIKMAAKKLESSEFEHISMGLKYGKILIKIHNGLLEIIDAISGTRYGAKLAFRGGDIYQTRKEIIYESEDLKIFVDSYDADELILSVRVKDYGEINVLDDKNNILRSTSGKSGLDMRIKPGKYIVRYKEEEILIQLDKE